MKVCSILRSYVRQHIRLTLFTHDECTLCHHFKVQMKPYLTQDMTVTEVDIKRVDNAKWFDLYKYDVPVLHVNDQFAMKHKFDCDIFENILMNIRQSGK